jgi:hypothetical protein
LHLRAVSDPPCPMLSWASLSWSRDRRETFAPFFPVVPPPRRDETVCRRLPVARPTRCAPAPCPLLIHSVPRAAGVGCRPNRGSAVPSAVAIARPVVGSVESSRRAASPRRGSSRTAVAPLQPLGVSMDVIRSSLAPCPRTVPRRTTCVPRRSALRPGPPGWGGVCSTHSLPLGSRCRPPGIRRAAEPATSRSSSRHSVGPNRLEGRVRRSTEATHSLRRELVATRASEVTRVADTPDRGRAHRLVLSSPPTPVVPPTRFVEVPWRGPPSSRQRMLARWAVLARPREPGTTPGDAFARPKTGPPSTASVRRALPSCRPGASPPMGVGDGAFRGARASSRSAWGGQATAGSPAICSHARDRGFVPGRGSPRMPFTSAAVAKSDGESSRCSLFRRPAFPPRRSGATEASTLQNS